MFDYSGCIYPVGLNAEQVFYFNEENIDKVIFEGFQDEEEKRYQELYQKWLEKEGASAVATAFILGSNPVGWAAVGVGVSALVSWGFETAYENNFFGLQDGLDTAGKWLDDTGKNVGKAVSDSVDGVKNWVKDTADGVGAAISGGLSALNPFD